MILAGLALGTPPACAQMPDDGRAALAALRAGTDSEAVAVRRLIDSGPADLVRARAAAAAGLPLDPARLQRRPVAPALDAAPLYLRLGVLRQKSHGTGLDLPLEPPNPRYAYTRAQIASVRRYLANQRESVDLAHRAASRPFCLFRRDWSRGQSVRLSEVADPGIAVLLLRMEAYLWARDGHRAAALHNAVLILNIADQVAGDPPFAFGGPLNVRAKSLDILADVLEISHGNPQVAWQIGNILLTYPLHAALWYAKATELDLWLITLDETRRTTEPTWGWDAQTGRWTDVDDATPDQPVVPVSPEERRLLAGLWDAWEAQLIGDMARRITRLREGMPPAEVARTDTPPSALQTWAVRVMNLPPGPLPARDLARMGRIGWPVRAQENILQTAVSVFTHPAAPLRPLPDPFSGKPLGFRREGPRGFVLYSVGLDGTFRGGHPNDVPVPWQILFRFPAPPPAPLPEFWGWL